MNKENRDLVVTFVIIVVAMLIGIVLGYFSGKSGVEPIAPTDSQPAYIYSDISAQTGFLNSESIMARFECVEYYIAGEKEPVKDFLIDVYRYPELDNPVSYRVDTFEEAVMFFEGLK